MKAPPNGSSANSGEGERTNINSELWHACAGPLVSLPPVGSLVVYFPQGHSEQVAASMQKENDFIPNYPNLPSKLICVLHNVTLHADLETDEVYAQMTLQPVTKYDKQALLLSDLGLKQSRQPAEFFCKTLTASDTSTHGGFSVPRRAAEKIFPPLDYSMQPPAQELVARDLHDNSWTFRHIYRGQPKRHLLTTGWSVFVSSKRLFAGDSVLFIRDEKSQLLLGLRHANRQHPTLSSSVISSDSMHIGVLASAAHAAANYSLFTIFYNPRASPCEFVIPLAKYNKAMDTQISLGMRFRMMFETEESGVRRYMGTIIGISDLDSMHWKNSQWRKLQVGWDESAAGERPSRVSMWEIEPVVTPFYICPPPFFRPKLPKQPGMPDNDSDIENAFKRAMPWLGDDFGITDTQSSIFPGLSLVQWMNLQHNNQFPAATQSGFLQSMASSNAHAHQNNLISGDPSKLLSFQAPAPPLPGSLQFNKTNHQSQAGKLQQTEQQQEIQQVPQQHQAQSQQQATQQQACRPSSVKTGYSISGPHQISTNQTQQESVIYPERQQHQLLKGNTQSQRFSHSSANRNPSVPQESQMEHKPSLIPNGRNQQQTQLQQQPPLQLLQQQAPLQLLQQQAPLQLLQQQPPLQLLQQTLSQRLQPHQMLPDQHPQEFVPQASLQFPPQLQPQHQQILEMHHQHQILSHLPLSHQQQPNTHLYSSTEKLLNTNSYSTTSLMQSQQAPLSQSQGQFRPLTTLRPPDGDALSCSTPPSTNSCQLSSSNLLDRNQVTLVGESSVEPTNTMMADLQSKSGTQMKHELPPAIRPDQLKYKGALADQMEASSGTAYCMDPVTIRHISPLPTFCLDSDTHPHSRSNLPLTSNIDGLVPDTLLSAGYDSQKDLQNLLSDYMGIPPREIETELSTALVNPQMQDMPPSKPGCSTDVTINEARALSSGLWANQTPRMRTYTKVQKRGSVGRCIDVTRYKGYDELRHDLARMFGIEGQLEDVQRTDWKLVYVDHENDILLVGDDPWEEFVSCVQSIKILSAGEVQRMSLDGDFGQIPNPIQACSGTDSENAWRGQCDDNSATSFNR